MEEGEGKKEERWATGRKGKKRRGKKGEDGHRKNG